jgi:hypothetical protein
MEILIGKKPSAWIPVVMSLVALVLVLIQLGIHLVEPERDDGAVAHLWQLLMAAQLPIIAFFAFRWARRARWQAATVLVVQAIAAAAASVLPVFIFGWYTL